MNSFFKRIPAPKISDSINGYADKILAGVPDILLKVFADTATSITSDRIKLEVLDYTIVPPDEVMRNLHSGNAKTKHDIATSTMYTARFFFRYTDARGEVNEFYKDILLLYSTGGNLVKFSGTDYFVVPVLSDTVISPSSESVFIRVLKDKIPVEKFYRSIIRNGVKYAGLILHATIMKVSDEQVGDVLGGKVYTPIALYPIAKYGFKKWLSRTLDITGDKDVIVTMSGDIDTDQYTVYESTRTKPQQTGNKRTRNTFDEVARDNIVISSSNDLGYVGHGLRIAVHNNVIKTLAANNKLHILENAISGIIYTMDVFSNTSEHTAMLFANSYSTNQVDDETHYWKLLIARLAYNNNYTVERLSTDVMQHFSVLEGYLDILAKNALRTIGIDSNDFFELLDILLDRYMQLQLHSKTYNSDIANRYFDIIYYLCYPLFSAYNKVIFGINRQIVKSEYSGGNVDVTFATIESLMNREFKRETITRLVKTGGQNIALIVADSIPDIKYPKGTAFQEDQSRGYGVLKGANTAFPEFARFIRAVDCLFGSILNLPKGAPSGRFRLNIFCGYNPYTGKIYVSPEMEAKLARLDQELLGVASITTETISQFGIDPTDDVLEVEDDGEEQITDELDDEVLDDE